MNTYRHHVSGFFAHRAQAQAALSKLVKRGLKHGQIQIFDADSAHSASAPQSGSNKALKKMLVDGAIGAAVGTGMGALAEVALVAMNVSLFIASPLLAPLVLMGWGASIGGLAGAAIGAESKVGKKHGWLSDLIRDAISSGQVVLVAETSSRSETQIAQEVIEASIGDYKDTKASASNFKIADKV